jgi:hypothetical protein
MLLDPEWRAWADREIARQCGVSHPFVGKVRLDLEAASAGAAVEDDDDERRYVDKHGTETTMRRGRRPRRQLKASDEDSDEGEEDDTFSVAGSSDRDALEVEALRRANERLSQDKRALQMKVEAQEGEIADLKKMVETLQRSPRAGEPTEPQTLAQMFNRAVDVLALLDEAISKGPNIWPEKMKSRERNKQIKEVHDFLARLRGFRDVVEIYEPPPAMLEWRAGKKSELTPGHVSHAAKVNGGAHYYISPTTGFPSLKFSGYNVTYYATDKLGVDEGEILASNVRTATEAKAIAQHHHSKADSNHE